MLHLDEDHCLCRHTGTELRSKSSISQLCVINRYQPLAKLHSVHIFERLPSCWEPLKPVGTHSLISSFPFAFILLVWFSSWLQAFQVKVHSGVWWFLVSWMYIYTAKYSTSWTFSWILELSSTLYPLVTCDVPFALDQKLLFDVVPTYCALVWFVIWSWTMWFLFNLNEISSPGPHSVQVYKVKIFWRKPTPGYSRHVLLSSKNFTLLWHFCWSTEADNVDVARIFPH